MHHHNKISAILLGGGSGKRMDTSTPKQFLPLGPKLIIRHSFDLLLSIPEIDEIIVICDPAYQKLFSSDNTAKTIRFALPGKERQDSVYNGLMEASPHYDLICIHDGARPFIDRALVMSVIEAASIHGAATLGMPVKFSIKEIDSQNFVTSTLDRSRLYEIQTPQAIQRDILLKGFHYAHTHSINVTDDVSLAELIGQEVKLIEGSHLNIKITMPIDLILAHNLLKNLPEITFIPVQSLI